MMTAQQRPTSTAPSAPAARPSSGRASTFSPSSEADAAADGAARKTEAKPKPRADEDMGDARPDDEDDDEEEEDDDDGKENVNSDADGADDHNAKDKSEADADDKQESKKSRRELPPHTVAILKGWMLSTEHFKHPYPTDEDKQMLLKKTGITMKQLTNWFTNARKRIWKPMMKREHSRQMQNAMEVDPTRGGVGVRAPFAGVAMQYRDGMFPARQVVRHSFDGGAPREAGIYAQQYEVAVGPHGYPVGTGGVAIYGARSGRSYSEASAIYGFEGGADAMLGRKRALEASAEQPGKRFRVTAAVSSPRVLKILQDWVSTHSYPTPTDADKLQLSRDTGLDVQQLETWFNAHVGRAAMPQQQMHLHMQNRAGYPVPAGRSSVYSQPPAYGERQSVPFEGNPMFPPRAVASARGSTPGPGNPQFPSGPGVRRGTSSFSAAFTSQGRYDSAAGQPARQVQVSAGQYMQQVSAPSAAAAAAIPSPVGAPRSSVLPSLANRPGPTMGQARDGRSHTLDMGQFRRRTMNFQDILASTTQNNDLAASRSPVSRTSPRLAAAQEIAAFARNGRAAGPSQGEADAR